MTEYDLTSMVLQMPVVLRLATQNDIPKLEWYGQYKHYRNMFRRAFREQQLGRRLMLVADSNGFPIGQLFVQLHASRRMTAKNDQSAYLYALRVMEMFQGRGIGTQLIEYAERLSLQHGCWWATIAVAKENTSAQRLYERLGYRVYADDPGEWSYLDHRGKVQDVVEPCWLLEKRLKSR